VIAAKDEMCVTTTNGCASTDEAPCFRRHIIWRDKAYRVDLDEEEKTTHYRRIYSLFEMGE